MPKPTIAIATCRVSSVEQLESNSLNRQEKSVKEAAEFLKVTIPSDGLWSGSVSSKSGSNYNRKDLRAMLAYCKENTNVKYLIVDEIDRFMRSIDEMFYFEVLFREQVGVKIWYAGDPALNSDDPLTKLRRAMEAFKAEGSNLERKVKSIKGQIAALEQGKYPFSPKPAYRRGYERGVQEPDAIRAPILRNTLIRIVTRQVTPSEALVELNKSEFVAGRSLYKMDKFRKIVTDCFYAGIVEINKQVQVRNENGLHEPLITKQQHYELVKIMNDKKKNQSGPRINGNPKYPLSNYIHCDECKNKSNGRYVGFDHGNGKNTSRIYEKYRCRGCASYLTRQDVHQQVEQHFNKCSITDEGLKNLISALGVVWKQKEGQAEQEVNRLRHKLKTLNLAIGQQAEAAIDPSNASIKQEVLNSIAKKKEEAIKLEYQLDQLSESADNDKDQFIKFAFVFIENMSGKFFDVSKENRLRCKELVFPAGFYVDRNKKVYTPSVSSLYRLANNKKDLSETEKSHLVRVRRL